MECFHYYKIIILTHVTLQHKDIFKVNNVLQIPEFKYFPPVSRILSLLIVPSSELNNDATDIFLVCSVLEHAFVEIFLIYKERRNKMYASFYRSIC